MEEKVADSMERECMLCHRAESDPDLYGYKLEQEGLCVHVFCLLFATGLFQQPDGAAGLLGFLPDDVHHMIWKAAQKACFVCGESGAAITCCQTGCDRSFHLPCAAEGHCITQYLPHYRSFCSEHSPKQVVEVTPEEKDTCIICMEPVEDRKSYVTMVCPVCRHAWFHRGCIQGQATCAGFSCFQCPHCRDNEIFVLEMLIMGIQIPIRPPSWESRQAYAALSERHSHCDASECLCPGGREQADREGPWQLLLCSSCAAQGTHRSCSHWRNSLDSWECNSCAGLDTTSTASSELVDPSIDSSSASGPSHSSPASYSSSQAAVVQSLGSPAAGTSQLPSQSSCSSPAPETSRSSTASPEALESAHSSPVLESSSLSSTPWPMRMRHRSRSRRWAQNPSMWPRRCCGRRFASAPGAQSSTSREVALGLSHSSPVLESSSCSGAPGLLRTRGRSRLRPQPYTRSRRHRERSCAPAAGTESSTPRQVVLGPSHSSPDATVSSPSTASQLPSGSSYGSPTLETSSPSNGSQETLGPSHGSLELQPSSPRTTRQVASGSSHSSPVLEGSSCSPWPMRMRHCSRLWHQQ